MKKGSNSKIVMFFFKVSFYKNFYLFQYFVLRLYKHKSSVKLLACVVTFYLFLEKYLIDD